MRRNNIFCFDLPNSCTGFTNGLIHAYSLIKSGVIKNKILLITGGTGSFGKHVAIELNYMQKPKIILR